MENNISEKVMKKIESGREYRALVLETRDAEDLQDTRKLVEGYATTFEEPYYLYSFENEEGETVVVYEKVATDAFKNTDMSDVIFQYDHEGRVFARLSNDTMRLDIDDHGLKVTADLGGTEIGRALYEEIKGGYTNKMSFGFTVTDDEIIPDGKNYIRIINSIGKLFDVSAVSYPQNNYTEISSRKHCEGVITKLEVERLEELRKMQEIESKKELLTKRLLSLRKD